MKNIRINLKILATIMALVLGFSFCANSASATQLPQPIVNFIKAKYPKAGIRFDGLIELPDHTIYLPVTPLTYGSVENPAKVIKTIPAKTDFTKKPDMILFANNIALLKIIKENNQLTVNYSPEIPLSVKLGLLPQDLVVPRGLILPTELKVILGDLRIPLKPKKDEDDLVFFGTPSKTSKTPEQKVSIISGTVEKKALKVLPELDFMGNKVLYAANFKENRINVIDSHTGRITENMKLPAIPSNMVLTPDCRYILLPSMALSKIFVIDTFSSIFVKDLDVVKYPSSILFPANSKKVYVANKMSSSISEVDLDNMLVKKEIKVIGSPDNLVYDEENHNIIYNDSDSENIYALNPDSGLCKKVVQVSNISKLANSGNYLYILNRSAGELVVFDLKSNQEFKRIKVGQKPVDLQILDKKGEIYVLSAGSDELDIIEMHGYTLKKTVPLNSGGFASKITVVESENKMLITSQDSYQMALYDIDGGKILGYIPVSKNISFLQVSK